MYLLIRNQVGTATTEEINLHPTMYLLIRGRMKHLILEIINLHPTMYLLILILEIGVLQVVIKFTSHYVSINSAAYSLLPLKGLWFTSHYVSINSTDEARGRHASDNLHPTMYLLILPPTSATARQKHIYIPLCIY